MINHEKISALSYQSKWPEHNRLESKEKLTAQKRAGRATEYWKSNEIAEFQFRFCAHFSPLQKDLAQLWLPEPSGKRGMPLLIKDVNKAHLGTFIIPMDINSNFKYAV